MPATSAPDVPVDVWERSYAIDGGQQKLYRLLGGFLMSHHVMPMHASVEVWTREPCPKFLGEYSYWRVPRHGWFERIRHRVFRQPLRPLAYSDGGITSILRYPRYFEPFEKVFAGVSTVGEVDNAIQRLCAGKFPDNGYSLLRDRNCITFSRALIREIDLPWKLTDDESDRWLRRFLRRIAMVLHLRAAEAGSRGPLEAPPPVPQCLVNE
jgi:hypothetical protein